MDEALRWLRRVVRDPTKCIATIRRHSADASCASPDCLWMLRPSIPPARGHGQELVSLPELGDHLLGPVPLPVRTLQLKLLSATWATKVPRSGWTCSAHPRQSRRVLICESIGFGTGTTARALPFRHRSDRHPALRSRRNRPSPPRARSEHHLEFEAVSMREFNRSASNEVDRFVYRRAAARPRGAARVTRRDRHGPGVVEATLATRLWGAPETPRAAIIHPHARSAAGPADRCSRLSEPSSPPLP
jgi:hypothetical protein